MKIKRSGLWSAILLWCILAPHMASGETRYVSDVLVVTVRSQAGENFQMLETLKTNEPVEVLEDKGTYTRVTTPSGTEGWILTQYLSKETPKPIVIARLEKEKARLESRLKDLEASQATLKAELADLKGRHQETVGALESKFGQTQAQASQTAKDLATMTEKYNRLAEQSSDVVAVIQERDGLRAANSGLTTEVEYLRQETERLSRTGIIRWFLAGAAVLLVGWMVGRVSRKKKKYY